MNKTTISQAIQGSNQKNGVESGSAGPVVILSAQNRMRLLAHRYTMHTDAGHGWLAVPKEHLAILGIWDKITAYSYMKNGTAYLEEDCDCSTFCDAWEKATGLKFDFGACNNSYHDNSPIRNYEGYSVSAGPAPEPFDNKPINGMHIPLDDEL